MIVMLQRAQPFKRVKRQPAVAVVFLVLFMLFSLANQFVRTRDPALRVWFLDVGQGDAIFLETPHGKQVLIDGGPDQTVLSKLSSIMWPWDRTIDAVVVSHPDADHITGLIPVFERYQVHTIYETGVRGGTPVIAQLDEAMKQEPAQQVLVRAGQSIELDGVTIDMLWPTSQAVQTQKDRNNTSIIMRVRYGASVLLLTGDAEEEVEDEIAMTAGDVDVLKVGHHGSKTSTGWKLLEATKPEIAVISAGADNRYGHPHPIVLFRLIEHGSQIWRTDLEGDILVSTDGTFMKTTPAFLPF